MAGDSNQTTEKSGQASTQATQQEAQKNLQDLGKGYGRDARTNQIYYKGKQIEVFSLKTFQVISEDREDGYDAEDYYSFYKKGEKWNSIALGKPYIIYGPSNNYFDIEFNIPINCFDNKDNSTEFLKCYQKNILSDQWPTNPPMDANTLKIMGAKDIGNIMVVADKHRALIFNNSYPTRQDMVTINNISDLPSFVPIGEHRSNFIIHDDFTDAIIWYFKDKDYVYSRFGIVEGADPTTFEIMDYPYTRDKNYIFFKGKRIEGAIPNEFELLDYRLRIARDKTKLFYRDKVLEGFDINTFKVISSPFPEKQYYGMGSDYKEGLQCPIALLVDKDHMYFLDMFTLLQPKFTLLEPIDSISIITDERKEGYTPKRIEGLIQLPLFKNHTEIQVAGVQGRDCKTSSRMFVRSNNTIFYIYRGDGVLSIKRMDEIDAESFQTGGLGWVDKDKKYNYMIKDGIIKKIDMSKLNR